MEIRTLKGPDEIIPAIPHIARLRLTVFHEWPYLYDGTMEEEEVDGVRLRLRGHRCVQSLGQLR